MSKIKIDGDSIDWAQESLIFATQYILAQSGISLTTDAIRDLSDYLGDGYTPKAAVNAFMAMGFDASFGKIKQSGLRPSHCPAIGFFQDQSAVIVQSVDRTGDIVVILFDAQGRAQQKTYTAEAAKTILTPYFLLARKQPMEDASSGKNDWLWGSFRQSKWLYMQVGIAAALSNFLGLSTSLFIMVVYDRVVPNAAIESLIALTIGVLIALGFDFVIKTIRAQFIDRAARRADARMSRLIFDRILALRLDGARKKAGAMASIVREFDSLRDFFTSATLIAVVDLPFIAFFIWVISLIAGPLALVPLIAVPVVIVTSLGLQPFLARLAARNMQTGLSKQAVLVETLSGLETIQATGSARLMRQRFEAATDAQSNFGFQSRALSNFAINAAGSVQQFAQIATIFYGVFLIQDGVITMGAMIAAVILGGRALAPLTQLAAAISRGNAARQAFLSLSAVMQGTAQKRHSGRLRRPRFDGAIQLDHLSYGFEGGKTPLLQDISLTIPAGQKVAIIGRMGSGKSTLIKLLSGLITPTSGSVRLDGVDLRQIERADLTRNIGVMPQEAWLFSGTIKENLQMGFYEYSDAHLLRIAQICGVDSFVGQDPQGYARVINERGEGLSGGQRQSISLARAMLHQPPVLVLDEPTSAMDTASETVVIEQMRQWMAGRTVVMVTHRNAVLELADRVLVMERGRIVMDKPPGEILQAKA